MSARVSRLMAYGIGLSIVALGLVHSAWAAVTVTDAPNFVIAANAGEAIAVDCDAGSVRVFVNAAPTTYTTACSAVLTITVNRSNAGNTTDLSAVTAAIFSSLTMTTVESGSGVDTMLGSELDDTFIWDPGDGNDTITGNGGTDTMLFNGSGGNEVMTFAANGDRFIFTRSLGNIVMDVGEVEIARVNALGGSDVFNTLGLVGVRQELNGGGDPGDILNYDAQNGCASQVDSRIVQAGVGPVVFTGFAEVNILNNECVGVPALNPTLLLTLSGLLGAGGLYVLRRRRIHTRARRSPR
jgi:Ca2+-binding RTX toxin-like protein